MQLRMDGLKIFTTTTVSEIRASDVLPCSKASPCGAKITDIRTMRYMGGALAKVAKGVIANIGL